jgi:hypothetical protein
MNTEVSNEITCFWCERTSTPGFGANITNGISFCWQSVVCPFELCDEIRKKVDTVEDNYECPVCYETKKSMEMPACSHKVCLDCYKTIYFGISTSTKPQIYELNLPTWPYLQYDEEGEVIEKYDEEGRIFYCEKEEEYRNFNYEKLNFANEDDERNYDELVETRNRLMEERPEWMNVEEIINYENELFRVCTEFNNGQTEYMNNLTKGNQSCPLCRSEVEW